MSLSFYSKSEPSRTKPSGSTSLSFYAKPVESNRLGGGKGAIESNYYTFGMSNLGEFGEKKMISKKSSKFSQNYLFAAFALFAVVLAKCAHYKLKVK